MALTSFELVNIAKIFLRVFLAVLVVFFLYILAFNSFHIYILYNEKLHIIIDNNWLKWNQTLSARSYSHKFDKMRYKVSKAKLAKSQKNCLTREMIMNFLLTILFSVQQSFIKTNLQGYSSDFRSLWFRLFQRWIIRASAVQSQNSF